MENIDNNPMESQNSENVQNTHSRMEEPQGEFVSPQNTRKKESPYADSPYERNNDCQWHPQTPEYRSPDKPTGKPHKVMKTVVSAIVAVALVGGSIAGTAAVVNHQWENKADALQDDFNQRLDDIQNQIDSKTNSGIHGGTDMVNGALTPSQVYAQNVKSVVAISNQGITTNIFGQLSQTASSGSGFILTEDGYVVTNYHVIEGATKLTVILHDETEYKAKVIGYEKSNDLALLKIEAENLPAVRVGTSDDLIVGDMVVAIGNPLGELTSTQTVGYISAINRDVPMSGRSSINMLQTDAAINPGNSGGPLFNAKGEVVGITTAKYSGTTNSGASIEGIGFAIPIDDVMDIITDLKDHGYITGAYLGVRVSDMDRKTADAYGLPLGVYISEATEGFCAEKSGVKAKDILIGLDEIKITTVSDLTRALRKYEPGDKVQLKLYRAGQELTVPVVLDEKPNTIDNQDSSAQTPMPDEGSYEEWREFFEHEFGNIFGD